MSATWKAIQRSVGVEADGIPGDKTAQAIAAKLGLSFVDKAEHPSAEPLWMVEARKYVGLREIPGAKHNSTILRWWEAIRAPFKDDETPWCAGFVGGILEEAGHESSRSGMARSYLNWGMKLSKPAQGAVVVLWRGSPGGSSGHVGFLAGISTSGDLWILGGNQSDAVTVAKFPASRLLGFRWPAGVDPDVYPVRRLNAAGKYSERES